PLRVRRVGRDWWKVFGQHHYLSQNISSGASCFMAEVGGRPAAFTAVVHQPGRAYHSFREHRTVCLPDFQGVGICNAMSELIAGAYAATSVPYHSVTSHPAMIAHRLRSRSWRCRRLPSLAQVVNAQRIGRTARLKRALSSRAAMRLTASFEFVGPSNFSSAR